jgi:hypothetical protein
MGLDDQIVIYFCKAIKQHINFMWLVINYVATQQINGKVGHYPRASFKKNYRLGTPFHLAVVSQKIL